MRRFEKILAILAFLLIVLAFVPTFGQGRGKGKKEKDEYPRVEQERGNREDYETERGRRDDDKYIRGEVISTITRLQKRSREFERRLDRELEKIDDRGGFKNLWDKKDYVLSLARAFRKATDRLEDRYRATRSLSKTYYDAQEVLRLGQELENALRTYDLNKKLEKDWDRIREDLNQLANIYARYNDDRTRRNRGKRGYPKAPSSFPFPF